MTPNVPNVERGWRLVVWLGVACLGLLSVASLSAQDPKLRATLQGHTNAVVSVAFSPDSIFLIVTFRLLSGPQRLARVLPVVLTFGCLAFDVAAPEAAVDLHLITRVYQSGGPDAINRWGQGLIREQQGVSDSRRIEHDQLPPGIRAHLPGWASVGGTLWSDLPRVRIELGGGFYHYGVVVYPSGSVPTAEWWQWVLDWPAEVIIYHED